MAEIRNVQAGIVPAQRGTFVTTIGTRREMRCFGIMEHELDTLKRWSAELGGLLSLAVFCFGYAVDWLIEVAVNDVARQDVAWSFIVLMAIGVVVFSGLAWRRWDDIRTSVDTIKRQSTDHAPPSDS